MTLTSLFYLIHVVISVDDLMGGDEIHDLAGWQLGLQYHDPVGILRSPGFSRLNESRRHHSTTLLRVIRHKVRPGYETSGQRAPSRRGHMPEDG